MRWRMVDVSTLESLALENKDLQAPSPQDSISRQVLPHLDSWKSVFVFCAHPLRRAWASLFAGPELSPEHVEWIRARDALERGDTDPFWRFVEGFLGRSPDDWLRGVLERHYLPHGGAIPTPIMLELLRHHKKRLESPDRGKWYVKQLAPTVERHLNKALGHDLMRSLESYGKSSTERLEGLRQNLPGVLVQAEADGYYFTDGMFRNELLGEVERIVIADNRPLRETRKRAEDEAGHRQYKIVSLTAVPDATDVLVDKSALKPYEGIEDELLLNSLITQAGLSERESEVSDLYRQGYAPQHIASRLGMKRATVDTHLRNIRQKLTRVS